MPIFFFDIIDIDGTLRKDTIGTNLAHPEAAMAVAVKKRDALARRAIDRRDTSVLRVEVQDQFGKRVT